MQVLLNISAVKEIGDGASVAGPIVESPRGRLPATGDFCRAGPLSR